MNKQPLPNWSTGYNGGGADGGVGVPAGTFGISIPPTIQYPTRLRVLGTSNQPCALTPGTALNGSASNDIECVLDTAELDLFVEGVTFDIVVPQGGCDYVLYSPYFYASWPSGSGPTAVSYTAQPDGTFSNQVNSQNGVPTCAFDYSKTYVGGPDCCSGTYTLTITSAQTGKTTTAVANWGGVSGLCYDGAAFLLDGVALDAAGFPKDPIYFVNRTAQQIRIHHKGLAATYPPIIVPLANYWKEAPLSSTPPVALTAGVARSDYELLCLDNADEVLGRIRLNVRSWTLKSELAADGNPDTTGTEPYFNTPIDDFVDWADLAQQSIDYTRVVRKQ